MRLFIAIDIPQEIRADLVHSCQALYKKYGKEVKFVAEEKLHLTLKFLKREDKESIEASQLREIIKVLAEMAKQATLWNFALGETTAFPSEKDPQVLIILAQAEGFKDFVKEMDSVLENLGFAPIKNFKLHCTLGRIKQKMRRPDKMFELANFCLKDKTYSWQTNQFVLYESHLSSRGSTYEQIAVFPKREKK